MRSISLLVLNYNGSSIAVAGESLLDIALPTILAASESYAGISEVIVIDNNSTDNSYEHISERYPSVKVLKIKKNDYLFSYNEVIAAIDSDCVMLLNNDMCLDADALGPLTASFDDDAMFAVGADVFLTSDGSPSNIPDSRCMRMQWYKGRLFPVDISGMIEHGLPRPFYALGGAIVFDTKKIRQLGGLDRIFYPYNYEDSDIAFRAHCKGWKIKINEQARGYHLGSKSIGAFIERNAANSVFLTNEYTFIWKNIRSKKLLFLSMFWMPWHMMRYRFGGVPAYIRAFIAALVKIKAIRKKRIEQFSSDSSETDALFFNKDLKGAVMKFMWAKVYCAANESVRAFAIVRELYVEHSDKRDYVKRSLQSLTADCLVVLFQSNKYSKVKEQAALIPKELLNTHAMYTLASSFRMLKEHAEAITLYRAIADNGEANMRIRGAALYHGASIMKSNNNNEEARLLGSRCLEIMPEHKKCRELLEAVV